VLSSKVNPDLDSNPSFQGVGVHLFYRKIVFLPCSGQAQVSKRPKRFLEEFKKVLEHHFCRLFGAGNSLLSVSQAGSRSRGPLACLSELTLLLSTALVAAVQLLAACTACTDWLDRNQRLQKKMMIKSKMMINQSVQC
jgi:hypothetical protein